MFQFLSAERKSVRAQKNDSGGMNPIQQIPEFQFGGIILPIQICKAKRYAEIQTGFFQLSKPAES